MDGAARIAAAAERIAGHVRRTPIDRSPRLSERLGCNVWLKYECYQRTGSFKLRGAVNKLRQLDAGTLARGVVAASTGNHGAAVACAAAQLGSSALVFAPRHAARSKLAGIEAYGAEVRFEGEDCVVAERAAREHADRESLCYVSPYNDREVIDGQGTVGLEIDQDLERCDAVYVSLGGGGLMSGIGDYLTSVRPSVQMVGASPRQSPVLHESINAGEVVEMDCGPTLSDGTAGGMERDSITLPICRRVVGRSLVVGEAEIAAAMRRLVGEEHVLVEGAAALALAALEQNAAAHRDQDVVVVLCGANVDPAVLREVLAG